MTTPRTRPSLAILLLLLVACSSTAKGKGTGGSRDSGMGGGTSGTGGALATGGVSASGGSFADAGGMLGNGGMAGAGGKPATGGFSGAGGVPGSGGVPGTGGAGTGGGGPNSIDAASSGGNAGNQAGGSGGYSDGSQAGGSSGASSDTMDGAGQALDAADAFTALQILQVQVLSGGDCAVPSVPTSMRRSSGTLDLALPDGSAPPYYLPVVVANNLDSSASTPATEMNNLTLTHFTVDLSAPNVAWTSTCPSTFDTVAVSDLLAPRTTAGVLLNAITPSHARCLLPYVTGAPLQVTASISAKGRHGGTNIASPPFVYSIEVCAGCLQQGYSPPALKPYQYPAAPPLCSTLTGVNPCAGDPCFPPGQDYQILCCTLPSTTGGTRNDVIASALVCSPARPRPTLPLPATTAAARARWWPPSLLAARLSSRRRARHHSCWACTPPALLQAGSRPIVQGADDDLAWLHRGEGVVAIVLCP